MDIKQLLEKLAYFTEEQINEMGSFYTKLPFDKFRDECLKRYAYKQAKISFKNQDTALIKKENNIDIYDRCIEHVYKRHKDMDNNKWKIFLNSFNLQTDTKQKAKYNGKIRERYVFKCNNETHYFGYVIDFIKNKSPRLVTVFEGHPNSVDNWFENVVNGTEII